MKICIAGKNNIAVEIVEYLLYEIRIDKNNIYIIINQTDDGVDNWQCSLSKFAKLNNLKMVLLDDIYYEVNMIFLSLEFDKIIKPQMFATNKLFNLHFSLLPKYKGMYTSVMPILNNEQYTGVTLHCIDKGIDTGMIIDQKKFKIEHNDNARDIYFKYIKYGIALVRENIVNLMNNNFIAKNQNYLESTYYSKNSIDFNKIKIDLVQTAISVHNQIRAYNFKDYQQPIVFNTNIIRSKILNKRSNKKAGTILFENDSSFVISSIDYDVVLYKENKEDIK